MADVGRDGLSQPLPGSAEADGELLLRHLALAAEVSSDAMLCLGSDGEVVSWNPAAVRLLSPALRLSPQVDLAEAFGDTAGFQDLVARCMRGERIRNALVRVDGVDGRGGPALVSLAALAAGPDQAPCVTVVLRDISEEVAAQEVLAEAERRVQQAEALAHTGTFVKDARDLSSQWSAGMYVVHGIEPGSVLPSREAHLQLVHPDDRAAVHRTIDEALAGEDGVDCTYRLDTGGDAERWIHMVVQAKQGEGGVAVGLTGVCQDITDRVEAEARLKQALALEQAASEDLRRLDAIKDEFLATVSHELRSPITTVLGFAQHLRTQAPEHDPFLEPIERNARNMSRLIELLLDEARLAQGKVTLAVERLPVESTARTIIEDRVAGAESPWALEVEPDLTIDMDPDAFALVLGNLVSNAVKYGRGEPIEVSAESRSGATLIRVSDHGPGIPPEYQEHLFESFYRTPGSGEIARGSGLGLSIVRRYVELHGGNISCRSDPGEGATFIVEIPVRAGDPATWNSPGSWG